ncbi:hypothetical protein SAMN05443667_1192 [Flavobacterium gillisiae]|uniref:Uncharacterized protein n=1 Tax=Flavobacterium gillisiae TaxID=150146 RepID=A0A1H4G9P3_9FLAO|nr:hypothetical protein [Flavobacterium gillisiae]SEB06335.1 hypothetical protein SAMN05443667_1192 [Flavobacterium gillisiae]
MKSIIIKTFTATATIGLYKAYSNELISIIDFKKILYKAQEQIKKEFDVALSTKLTLCEIVFLGQEEPSVSLDFIQYPKFPTEEVLLKKAIIQLVKLLMENLDQNRTVIVFQEETICLEKSERIDPKIQF